MQDLETRNAAASDAPATILALVVLANDETRITATLDSVDWTSARIAVDLGCTDGTVDVCRRRGVPVVAPADVDREVARVHADWILLLEGHERVPGDLVAEIRRVAGKAGEPAAYVVDREIEFLGRTLRSRVWNVPGSIRLIRRGAWSWETGALALEVGGANGARPGRLSHRLRARPYESLQHFMTRADILSTAGARRLCRSGAAVSWTDLALHPAARAARRLPGASLRDGIVGAILVVLDAYRLVLVAAKRWELERGAEQPGPPR
jgi:hypothetical protein